MVVSGLSKLACYQNHQWKIKVFMKQPQKLEKQELPLQTEVGEKCWVLKPNYQQKEIEIYFCKLRWNKTKGTKTLKIRQLIKNEQKRQQKLH